jgi:ABC-type ATPase involved in cell division
MKLMRLATRNFLSLADGSIDNLDPNAVVLVGPSGAGKSNVFRAISALPAAFGDGGHLVLGGYVANNAPKREVEVSAKVVFETTYERRLLSAFIAAALSNPGEWRQFTPQGHPNPVRVEDDRLRAYADWLLAVFDPKRCDSLFVGDTWATWTGSLGGQLRLGYSFGSDTSRIHLLSGTSDLDGRLAFGEPPKRTGGGQHATSLIRLFEKAGADGSSNTLIEFLSGAATEQPEMPTWEELLSFLAKGEVFLNVHPITANDPEMPAHRILEELSGEPFTHSNVYHSFRWLFHLLLRRSLIRTPNQRMPYRSAPSYDQEQLASSASPTADEALIPLVLYQLKNGTFRQQERFRRVRAAFTDLMGGGESFDLEVSHKGGQATIDVRISDPAGECSLALHGAGTWEALILAALLLEAEGKVVLLDEPAANLHPPMQRRLFALFQESPGQVLVATHASDLVPKRAKHLHQILRLTKEGRYSAIHRLPPGWSRGSRAEVELRSSNAASGLLFTKGVVVVEGPTEAAALADWFSSIPTARGRSIDELAMAIHPAGGESGIPFFLEFLNAFGIRAAVICDGDALQRGARVRRYVASQSSLPDDSNFETVRSTAERLGIFTFSTDFSGDFESIPSVAAALVAKGRSKLANGIELARSIPCPAEVGIALTNALAWLTGTGVEDGNPTTSDPAGLSRVEVTSPVQATHQAPR